MTETASVTPLFGLDTTAPPPRVVMSYGLGVDSTGILLRWLYEPASRDFDLADLALVISHTGDEFASVGRAVTDAVFPLLREHGVRTIQAGRSTRRVTKAGVGVRVFSDTRTPTTLFMNAGYKLSDEMRAAGTVPQAGGNRRLCSIHAKAEVLEPVIARITAGRPYRHVLGFEAGREQSRAARDTTYNTALRTGEYPLITWGWTRAHATRYIHRKTGLTWEKSACSYCPFAMSSVAGRAATFARWAAEPQAGVTALAMEWTSLALNPRQGLLPGRRIIDDARAAGLDTVLDLFAAHLAATPYALYEVRRITRPHPTDPHKFGPTARSIRILARGSRAAMEIALAAAPGDPQRGPDGIPRNVLRERGTVAPLLEHFITAAPDGVEAKSRSTFAAWWNEALGETLAA